MCPSSYSEAHQRNLFCQEKQDIYSNEEVQGYMASSNIQNGNGSPHHRIKIHFYLVFRTLCISHVLPAIRHRWRCHGVWWYHHKRCGQDDTG